jgi:hypothetical protein
VPQAIIELFISFILAFTPGEAMLIGALVGLLPLLLFLRRRARPSDDSPAVRTTAVPESPGPSAHDRLLTCVICKRQVRMGLFASHIASHDTEGSVSAPRLSAAPHGQQQPTPRDFPTNHYS